MATENYRPITGKKSPTISVEQRKKDWADIEDMVMCYKLQFDPEATQEGIKKGNAAGYDLVLKFNPLIKKYSSLLKNGQINFNDPEMKAFVNSFINDKSLKRALGRHKQKAHYRSDIYKQFNFILETYGQLPESEIITDLQMLILTMARRYEPQGRNFCAYVYNSFRYEVSRHVKKYFKDPLGIPYKHIQYDDFLEQNEGGVFNAFDEALEERFYEDAMGLPDITWISGLSASDIFENLTPVERKMLIKYYLEDWNDRQISEEFGIHINTVNQIRRSAIGKLAEKLNIDPKDIKRSRKSGKKAVIPYKSAS